jgi:predicted SprT family Zn-dependent metalloprotease
MNDLREVERHARALMTAHGVGSLTFEFDRGKRRIGATHFIRVGTTVLPRRITLSKHFAELLTMEEIRDTMLHEIAHALAGHAAGHGVRWQKEARKLGITPSRCKAASSAPERAWEGVCQNCGEVRSKFHRAPLRVYMCAGSECKGDTNRQRALVWRKNGTFVPVQDMPQRFQDEWLINFA